MKNILVTGGAGFIGSNFIRHILSSREDLRIVNLDKLTYAGNLENLRDVETHSNYEFVLGDITNSAQVAEIFSKYDFNYVINFAAETHVDRSILGSEDFVKTNILGAQVLLDNSLNHKIEKYIQISTDEVYGSLGETGLFSEKTPLSPNSPYSASKTSADLLVRSYYKTHGFPAMITRCSNNYGPYQFPEKLIPLMIINAMNDKNLPVYGDGKNVRDWIYVLDHNKAVEKVLEFGVPGEVYNIGASQEMQNIEIIKLILKELGKPESLIQYVKDRPGHDRRYAIDSSKIQNQLGWTPESKFEEAIIETINWYKSNKSWWERIISGDYLEYYKKNYNSKTL